MTKLIIFRHGQTEANVQDLFRGVGLPEDSLTAQGVSQVEALRDKLLDKDLELIVCSPLKRAIQTATIVAAPKNIKIEYYEGIIEANLGVMEGKSREHYITMYPDVFIARTTYGHPEFWTAKVKNMENRAELLERAKEVIKYLKENYGHKKVIAISTHGFFMLHLYYALFGTSREMFENAEYFEAII